MRIRVRVLCNDEAKAYAWTDGEIYVTRGLVRQLSANELSAVIAHELGHLLDDGTLQTVFALHGGTAGEDVEVRADSLGVQLLVAANLPGSAMREMLQKLKDFATTSRDERERIADRISRLQHAH
jgi:predicted Zn-dependent protease